MYLKTTTERGPEVRIGWEDLEGVRGNSGGKHDQNTMQTCIGFPNNFKKLKNEILMTKKIP